MSNLHNTALLIQAISDFLASKSTSTTERERLLTILDSLGCTNLTQLFFVCFGGDYKALSSALRNAGLYEEFQIGLPVMGV